MRRGTVQRAPTVTNIADQDNPVHMIGHNSVFQNIDILADFGGFDPFILGNFAEFI